MVYFRMLNQSFQRLYSMFLVVIFNFFNHYNPIFLNSFFLVSKANFFSTEFNSLSAGFKEPKFIERFERMTDLSYVNLLKPWTYFFRYELFNSLILFTTKNMDNLKSLWLILRFQRSVREVRVVIVITIGCSYR